MVVGPESDFKRYEDALSRARDGTSNGQVSVIVVPILRARHERPKPTTMGPGAADRCPPSPLHFLRREAARICFSAHVGLAQGSVAAQLLERAEDAPPPLDPLLDQRVVVHGRQRSGDAPPRLRAANDAADRGRGDDGDSEVSHVWITSQNPYRPPNACLGAICPSNRLGPSARERAHRTIAEAKMRSPQMCRSLRALTDTPPARVAGGWNDVRP